MSYLNANADIIIQAGTELKEVAGKYNNIINEFYPKLENIQNNGVWISGSDQGSASVFLRAVAKDKPKAQDLGVKINATGEGLIQYGKDLNVTASIKP